MHCDGNRKQFEQESPRPGPKCFQRHSLTGLNITTKFPELASVLFPRFPRSTRRNRQAAPSPVRKQRGGFQPQTLHSPSSLRKGLECWKPVAMKLGIYNRVVSSDAMTNEAPPQTRSREYEAPGGRRNKTGDSCPELGSQG
jgi:hypothetical protein